MPSIGSGRAFDLEDRTYRFALSIRQFLRKSPRSIITEVDGRQLIRSSGSIGANYIEANDNVGDRDFLYRIKLCRKEAKESRFWLKLLLVEEPSLIAEERAALANEADELMRIFAAIHRNSVAKKSASKS